MTTRRHPPRSAPTRVAVLGTLWAWLVLASAGSVSAVESVTLRRGMDEVRVDGQVVVEAEDKSFLLQSADGMLWTVKADDVVRRETDARPFKPLSAEDAGKRLLTQLPAGFEVYQTNHYVIVHNANKAYAQWVGALFERLYKAFHSFWTSRGFKLTEAKFPLCVVVFADEESYRAYVKKQHGAAMAQLPAFYGLDTNRVTLYDLTGIGALRREGNRRGTPEQINQMLSHKDAAQNVSTVVHEAFHQLAFNCGLSQRYADVPLWVAEGLAMYFETPDLASSQGWRTIGAINYGRLADMKASLDDRGANSLASLLSDNARFRDLRQARTAYAEAWALNHFLMQRHSKKYLQYLQTIAAKPPSVDDSAEQRVKEFETAIGKLGKVDAEFLKHVKGLR